MLAQIKRGSSFLFSWVRIGEVGGLATEEGAACAEAQLLETHLGVKRWEGVEGDGASSGPSRQGSVGTILLTTAPTHVHGKGKELVPVDSGRGGA